MSDTKQEQRALIGDAVARVHQELRTIEEVSQSVLDAMPFSTEFQRGWAYGTFSRLMSDIRVLVAEAEYRTSVAREEGLCK